MREAWAFLAAGAVDVFSGDRLPVPGQGAPADPWVAAPSALRPLARDALVHWLDEELWEVELAAGGARARLSRRLAGWDGAAAVELADACAWRARDQAVRALEGAGHASLAGQLAQLCDLARVETWAAARNVDVLPVHAALAADAAALAAGRRPDSWRRGTRGRGSRQPPAVIAANLAFVVAHGAGLERAAVATDGYGAGVAEERSWQTAWLTARLGLGGAGGGST